MIFLRALLSGVGLKVWGYAAAAGTVIFMLWSAWRKGRRSAHEEVNARTAGLTRQMLDAAVQAPTEKNDVVKDLRAGRF